MSLSKMYYDFIRQAFLVYFCPEYGSFLLRQKLRRSRWALFLGCVVFCRGIVQFLIWLQLSTCILCIRISYCLPVCALSWIVFLLLGWANFAYYLEQAYRSAVLAFCNVPFVFVYSTIAPFFQVFDNVGLLSCPLFQLMVLSPSLLMICMLLPLFRPPHVVSYF